MLYGRCNDRLNVPFHFVGETKNKLKLFITSNIIINLSIVIAVNQPFFIIMALFLALSGLFILISTVQSSTPQDSRGKVMAFITMTTQSLTPFAMAIGGVLGGIIPIRIVISAAFLVVFFITIPSYFSKPFKKYITSDYEEQEISDLTQNNINYNKSIEEMP